MSILPFLVLAVDPFKEEYISRAVLKKLIDHQGTVERKALNPGNEDGVYLYKKGTSADYFLCIIQGQVEVIVGNENLVFVDGPFTVFGMQALFAEKGQAFLPDYDVKLLSDVQYLKVTRSLYRSAIRASQLERSERDPSHLEEIDKLLWSSRTETQKHESKVKFDIESDDTGILLIPNAEPLATTDDLPARFETPI